MYISSIKLIDSKTRSFVNKLMNREKEKNKHVD